MFISEFSGGANFSLALFTILIHWMVNYINRIDRFTNDDGDMSNGLRISYEKILIAQVLN